jgi:hypothetical protein
VQTRHAASTEPHSGQLRGGVLCSCGASRPLCKCLRRQRAAARAAVPVNQRANTRSFTPLMYESGMLERGRTSR